MGRAVRSHADYAVVLLAGHDVASFVVKRDVQELMTADTREQIRLGIHLVEHAITSEVETEEEISRRDVAIKDMVAKCLGRDTGWKSFYDERIRQQKIDDAVIDEEKIKIADIERQAFSLAKGNDAKSAHDEIIKLVDDVKPDSKVKGILLHKAARYLFESDPAKSLELQAAAYKMNSKLTPAPGVVFRPHDLEKTEVQANVLAWFKSFDNLNGTIAAIAELRSRLNLALHYKKIEEALKELAEPLGAKGSRPENEFGKGPDDLWLWGKFDFIIEAKNQNEKSLHKKDAGQLSVSLSWHKENYPERTERVPIVVAKVSEIDDNAIFEEGTRLITQEELNALMDALEGFCHELAQKLPIEQQPGLIKDLQNKYGLNPESFIKKYSRDIKG